MAGNFDGYESGPDEPDRTVGASVDAPGLGLTVDDAVNAIAALQDYTKKGLQMLEGKRLALNEELEKVAVQMEDAKEVLQRCSYALEAFSAKKTEPQPGTDNIRGNVRVRGGF